MGERKKHESGMESERLTFEIDDPFSGILEDTSTSFLTFCCVGWVCSGQSSVYVSECVAVAQRPFVTHTEVVV